MPSNNMPENIIDYLKNKCISFVYGKTDKDKGFIHLPNNDYGNDINQAKKLFEKNQDYIEKTMKLNMDLYDLGCDYNTAFIDTNEYIQLDCDIKNDEEYSKLSQKGLNLLNKLITTYPHYKSATKKYGYHFIIGRISDITNTKILDVLKNNSSICEYNNWSNDKPCEKLNDDYGFLEIFCGTPIWCKTFQNINVENPNKNLPKSTTKTDTTKKLKTMLNADFLKNGGKVKQVKKSTTVELPSPNSTLNTIVIDDNYDYNTEIIKGIPTDKYYLSGYVFGLLIKCIWDKGDSVKQTLYDLGKLSPLAKPNYDEYFNKIYDSGKSLSNKISFGYAVNLCDREKLLALNQKKNTYMNISNEKLSQEFIELNRENIIQVKEGKNYELYYYNDKLNRWFNHSVQGSKSPLFYHIRTFCKNYIQKFINTVKDKITVATNNGDTELLDELLKKKDELNKRFNQFTNNDEQIKNIVSMLNQTFSTFTKLQEDCFDNKIHLLPFNNCVINLKKKGKAKFEEHSRDNYISMFINYDIPFNDEEKINKCVNDFEEMYDGLFTKDYQGVKEDLTFILALALTGIKCVFMPIFNGRGSNGKSVIFDILELVLGRDYFRQMKGDQISEDISTNKPSPEWANMDKKRFGVFKETNGNKCVINLATVKQLGEGNINARGLFSNRTEVINNANYVVMCNDKPSIVGQIDNSVERRIVDIRLPRIFGNPKDKNFQAKMKSDPDTYRECDTKYTEKDSEFVQENMKLGMLFYLLYYIEEFEETEGNGTSIFDIGQNFKFSDKTIENSKEYIKNEDIISEFLDEYLDFTIKNKPNYKDYCEMNCDFVNIVELYQKFRNTDTYKLLDDTDKKSYSQKNFIAATKSNNLVADKYVAQIKRKNLVTTRHYISDTYYKSEYMEENIRKQLVIEEEEEEEEENTFQPMEELIFDDPSDMEYPSDSDSD